MSIYFQELGLTVSKDESLSDGARLKYWCHDESGNVYLYKADKCHPTGETTFESVSECLAKRIGDILGIPVVNILLGDHYILSQVMPHCGLLHNFIEYSEEFSHSFHMSNLQTYTLSTLLSCKNRYLAEVIEMLFFDILIGNSDRHPGNFGYTDSGFYPLFDNGSSLCAYVKESVIVQFFSDSNRFRALCLSKSRPTIRGEVSLTHYELLHQLAKLFPQYLGVFKAKLSSFTTENLFDNLPISALRASLLEKFLQVRLKWFDEVNIDTQQTSFTWG